MIQKEKDGVNMENQDIILQEIEKLTVSPLTDKEQEFKKSFTKYFMSGKNNSRVSMSRLEDDYARIKQIKDEYPVMDFMNLLGKFDTIQEIDLDKLFNLK